MCDGLRRMRVVRDGTLITPDGRTLVYIGRGPENGVPVILSHGTPGSRFARHPDPEIYERHGVHVIAYDRPGYGRSDPKRGRSVVDAAADIAAIGDELGLERFAVVGGSGGAPHARACGALLGDRVTRVGALVTPAPSDAEDFDFFEILAELPEVDRRLASREDFRAIMKQSFVEAVRQGVRGWADDDLAFAKPWGFVLEDVVVETRVWQGELDVLTPRPHGEYVASRLPNARFELLEGGGHFLDEEWAVVFDWLTADAKAADRCTSCSPLRTTVGQTPSTATSS